MIARRTVWCLGLSQLIGWGVTYYLVGGFGEIMAADLGWSRSVIYGGFSASLLAMGLCSPVVGRLIDRHGGRPVMVAGSCLSALGCVALSLVGDVYSYFAAWVWLGVAMRLMLYDAAFAALARLGGSQAARPIAQITLLGGLASTVFWPIGHALAEAFGWRGAVLAYAGFCLVTLPLHLAIPAGPADDRPGARAAPDAPTAQAHPDKALAGLLYALIVTLTSFLNSGMSAHMIGILSGLGLAASAAVWVSTLRGIGQSSARLAQVLFGGRIPPLDLNLAATAVLPLCFLAGLLSGEWLAAAVAFALLYGAGNGVTTITRGTLPLVLFEPREYGTLVGRLIAPSFLLSAAAPLVYAAVIEHLGNAAALHMSALVAAAVFASSLVLRIKFSHRGGA